MSRITNDGRFIYATAKTKEGAQAELDDMFATGDVFESEKPLVEPIRDHHNRIKFWAVTLPA